MSGSFGKVSRKLLGVAALTGAIVTVLGAAPASADHWRRDGYYRDYYYDRPVVVRPKYYYPPPPPVYYAPPPPVYYAPPPPVYYAPPPRVYSSPSFSLGVTLPIR